jgi:hypothetical protein
MCAPVVIAGAHLRRVFRAAVLVVTLANIELDNVDLCPNWPALALRQQPPRWPRARRISNGHLDPCLVPATCHVDLVLAVNPPAGEVVLDAV